MKTSDSDVVYCGSLFVPSGKLLQRKKKTSWQEKYGILFKASKCGLERLEVYDNKECTKTASSRIITLENCIKITHEDPAQFSIITKTAPYTYEFMTESEHSRNEWLHMLQMVAFRDDTSCMTSIEEDNDLYCSAEEPAFTVKIHPSPASEKCRLDPQLNYTLLFTATEIHLRRSTDYQLLYSWPYCYIRRYGYKSGKFTFEAGRKCKTGEGTFFLEHPKQQDIFKSLGTKMKSMKKLLNEEVVDCGENHLLAVMNMEARSRTPIPASFHTVEANSFSSQSSINSAISQVNLIPAKPPRKALPKKPVERSPDFTSPQYEHVNRYDLIEYRSDAWKTMGVDDVNHTENVDRVDSDNEDESYASWGGHPDSQKTNHLKAPKVLTQPSVDPRDYDKLDFFGSSGKLNFKSGYKKVSLPLLPQLPVNPPSFNDYDEVQPVMEGVRLADDSHLGYALVRKETPKDKTEVNHHFQNNEPYAVISKPKRV